MADNTMEAKETLVWEAWQRAFELAQQKVLENKSDEQLIQFAETYGWYNANPSEGFDDDGQAYGVYKNLEGKIVVNHGRLSSQITKHLEDRGVMNALLAEWNAQLAEAKEEPGFNLDAFAKGFQLSEAGKKEINNPFKEHDEIASALSGASVDGKTYDVAKKELADNLSGNSEPTPASKSISPETAEKYFGKPKDGNPDFQNPKGLLAKLNPDQTIALAAALETRDEPGQFNDTFNTLFERYHYSDDALIKRYALQRVYEKANVSLNDEEFAKLFADSEKLFDERAKTYRLAMDAQLPANATPEMHREHALKMLAAMQTGRAYIKKRPELQNDNGTITLDNLPGYHDDYAKRLTALRADKKYTAASTEELLNEATKTAAGLQSPKMVESLSHALPKQNMKDITAWIGQEEKKAKERAESLGVSESAFPYELRSFLSEVKRINGRDTESISYEMGEIINETTHELACLEPKKAAELQKKFELAMTIGNFEFTNPATKTENKTFVHIAGLPMDQAVELVNKVKPIYGQVKKLPGGLPQEIVDRVLSNPAEKTALLERAETIKTALSTKEGIDLSYLVAAGDVQKLQDNEREKAFPDALKKVQAGTNPTKSLLDLTPQQIMGAGVIAKYEMRRAQVALDLKKSEYDKQMNVLIQRHFGDKKLYGVGFDYGSPYVFSVLVDELFSPDKKVELNNPDSIDNYIRVYAFKKIAETSGKLPPEEFRTAMQREYDEARKQIEEWTDTLVEDRKKQFRKEGIILENVDPTNDPFIKAQLEGDDQHAGMIRRKLKSSISAYELAQNLGGDQGLSVQEMSDYLDLIKSPKAKTPPAAKPALPQADLLHILTTLGESKAGADYTQQISAAEIRKLNAATKDVLVTDLPKGLGGLVTLKTGGGGVHLAAYELAAMQSGDVNVSGGNHAGLLLTRSEAKTLKLSTVEEGGRAKTRVTFANGVQKTFNVPLKLELYDEKTGAMLKQIDAGKALKLMGARAVEPPATPTPPTPPTPKVNPLNFGEWFAANRQALGKEALGVVPNYFDERRNDYVTPAGEASGAPGKGTFFYHLNPKESGTFTRYTYKEGFVSLSDSAAAGAGRNIELKAWDANGKHTPNAPKPVLYLTAYDAGKGAESDCMKNVTNVTCKDGKTTFTLNVNGEQRTLTSDNEVILRFKDAADHIYTVSAKELAKQYENARQHASLGVEKAILAGAQCAPCNEGSNVSLPHQVSSALRPMV